MSACQTMAEWPRSHQALAKENFLDLSAERLPGAHRAISLGGRLADTSPSARQTTCSAIARRALVGISGVVGLNVQHGTEQLAW